jgi:hypothetical protein
MAVFPYINTLATIHLNGGFGTDQSAGGAARARVFIDTGRCRVTAGVNISGNGQATLGAEMNTHSAAFAEGLVYFDISLFPGLAPGFCHGSRRHALTGY